MSGENRLSRRQFLKTATAATAAAVAAPYFVPASARGADGRPSPSSRIALSFIGIGNQSSGHFGAFLGNREVQVVALSDVRSRVRDKFKAMAEQRYAAQTDGGSYKGCDTYNDFREMLARKDIDAVVIGTPEHWHAIQVITAAREGKDIYCEKPLSHTLDEAKAMVAAVRRYGVVFQTGSQQRSEGNFRYACELVQNGRIGKLKTIHVGVGGTSNWAYFPEQPVEEGLDWNMWLGPAMYAPYNAERASGSYSGGWRLIRDYSGGMMCDWGAHHFDIAQWGMGMDGSGPVEVHPPDGKEYKMLTYKYASGVTVYHANGQGYAESPMPHGQRVNGILFTGTDGIVEVNRGYFRTWPDSIGKQPIGPNDIHLYESRDHRGDWLDCVRTRRRPICDVEVGASSISVCHLGNICYWLNRPIKWDPATKQIVGDEQARRMMDIPKRAPWRLEA